MKRIVCITSILLILSSCFPARQTAVEIKQTFTFDYLPKETNKAGSANMALAFIHPYYASEFTSGKGELFKAFQLGLDKDIEEIIIGKGFNMMGPYTALDEMVFSDKKTTDMIIQIEIAPRFTAQQGGWRTSFTLMNVDRTLYSYSGTASLVGKINLSGIEPMTFQKIWSKSVSIPDVENISIQTSGKYSRILNDLELINDPGVYNQLGKALKAQYVGIMDKIAAHFSVEEFKSLKDEAKELKTKKGY